MPSGTQLRDVHLLVASNCWQGKVASPCGQVFRARRPLRPLRFQ